MILDFYGFLNEAEEISMPTTGKKVCIFIGRFQPWQLGHVSGLEETSKKFGCPVIPIQVLSKNAKSPFPAPICKKLGANIVKQYSFIKDHVIWEKPGFLPDIVKYLRDHGYEPIGIGCGSDRYKNYITQADYLITGKYNVVSPSFEVLEVGESRENNEYSATNVRAALKNDDEERFRRLTPTSIHKFYVELKKYV